VKRFNDDTSPISRTIEQDPLSDNPQWTGFLTQAETTALALSDTDENKSTGLYRLIAQITNTEPSDLTKETVIVRFNLTTAW